MRNYDQSNLSMKKASFASTTRLRKQNGKLDTPDKIGGLDRSSSLSFSTTNHGDILAKHENTSCVRRGIALHPAVRRAVQMAFPRRRFPTLRKEVFKERLLCPARCGRTARRTARAGERRPPPSQMRLLDIVSIFSNSRWTSRSKRCFSDKPSTCTPSLGSSHDLI